MQGSRRAARFGDMLTSDEGVADTRESIYRFVRLHWKHLSKPDGGDVLSPSLCPARLGG